MSYFGWQPYVPVALRQRRAEQQAAKLRKKGQPIEPVRVEGRTIAKSFWGQSWCTNLERYSDYESRLPRGRTYLRNGSVLDLQIARSEVSAMVAGSELYKVKVTIAPVARARWKSICRDCAGSVSSLVELLQGRLARSVMDRVCREGDGLFPSPGEIKLSCSCPDWAGMCKHVAAALYGVGARLDSKPELLFVLRGVDQSELLSAFGRDAARKTAAPVNGKVLDDNDVVAVFGLELAETDAPDRAAPPAKGTSKRPKRSTAAATAGLPPPASNPHTRAGKRRKSANGRVVRAPKVNARAADPGKPPPSTKGKRKTAKTAATSPHAEF